MTHPDWATLRHELVQAWGDHPNAQTEQDIIDAYQLHPNAVEKAAQAVAREVINGTIRSGWGVLRTRAQKISTPVANPTRDSSVEREKRISRAEQYIRNTGCHLDRETELVDDLFGDHGLLQAYAGDPQLEARMVALWTERRPVAVALEQEAQERADRWKQQQETHPWNAPTRHTSSQQSPQPSSEQDSRSSSDGPRSHSPSASASSSPISQPADPPAATHPDDTPL